MPRTKEEIEKIKKQKIQMEIDILTYLSNRLEQFKRECADFNVCAIGVEIVDLEQYDCSRNQYMVRAVDCCITQL